MSKNEKNEGVVIYKSSYRISVAEWEKHQPWVRFD
jgi:hypothetical protein